MDLNDVRRMILEGRAAEAEARLRDDPRDPWALYTLAEVILLQSPTDIDRIEEAIDLYRKAEMRFGNAKEEALAKCARAKAVAMLQLSERSTSTAEPAKVDPLVATLKQCGFESFLPGERAALEAIIAGGHVFAVRPRRPQLLRDLAELMVDGKTVTMSDPKDAPTGEVRLLIVDRAHRASESAPDHDPALAAAVQSVRAQSILAIAGAATPGVRAEAINRLGFPKPFVLAGSMDAQGVQLSVIETTDKAASLRTIQEPVWIVGRNATAAPRAVVFETYPASMEEFYDQAVMAKEEAIILYDPADRAAHRTKVDEKFPDEAKLAVRGTKVGIGRYEVNGVVYEAGMIALARNQAEERLRAVERYIETRNCRRRQLLSYFGEVPPAGWSCSGCDRCKAAPASDDIIIAILDALRELQSKRLTVTDMARAILFMGPATSIRALKGKTETDVRQILLGMAREGKVEVDARTQQVKIRPGSG